MSGYSGAVPLVLVGALFGCPDAGGFRVDAGPTLVDGGQLPARDAGPSPDVGPQPDSGTPGARFIEQNLDDEIIHGQGLEVVDMDGDGDRDVLAALSLTDAVHLYRNEGRGERWTRLQLSPRGAIVAMELEAADFDGDSDLDVAAVGLFTRADGFGSPGEVVWYENPGAIANPWITHTITGRAFWAPRYVEAPDLTGDGLPDLVVGTLASSDPGAAAGVFWFRRQAQGFSIAQPIDLNLREVSALVAHDVDSNGVLDVVALGTESNEIVWYENRRTPGTIADAPRFVRHVLASPPAPRDLRFVDLDTDLPLELVVAVGRGEGGAIVAYDAQQDPRAPWVERTIAADFGGGERVRLVAADFDVDGRFDVAVSSYPAQQLRLYLNGGDAWTPQVVFSGYPGLNWIADGDIDGDGRTDLVTSTYELAPGRDVISWWRNAP